SVAGSIKELQSKPSRGVIDRYGRLAVEVIPSRPAGDRLPVHKCPPPVADLAYYRPVRWEFPPSREGGGKRVVLTAREHPVQRAGTAQGRGGRRQGGIAGKPGRVDVDLDAAGPGQVPGIGEQAVAHIDHRRGAEPGGLAPRPIRPTPPAA